MATLTPLQCPHCFRRVYLGPGLEEIPNRLPCPHCGKDLEDCPENEARSLKEIQKEVASWSETNFGQQVSQVTGFPLGSLAPLLGIMEELGELCHCVLKHHQGIRGYDDPSKYEPERDDALADILVYLCDFASREGVNLLHVLNETWEQVAKRNWKKNPSANPLPASPPAANVTREGFPFLVCNACETIISATTAETHEQGITCPICKAWIPHSTLDTLFGEGWRETP